MLNTPPSALARAWFALALVCFLTSGATGLLYEVVWSRYLGLLLGSTTYAHTIVLATFMAGLGLGNHLFGRVADRTASPLAAYGWMELGIGAYALLFPLIYPALTRLYLVVGGALGPDSAWVLPLKVVLGACSLLLPTTLMGGTLPMLSRALIREDAQIGQRVGLLYFINTAGAVLGCFLGGFWAVEALGLDTSMLAAAVANIVVGLGVVGLSRRAAHPAALIEPDDEPQPAPERARSPVAIGVMIAMGASGALAMLYELVWIRLVAYVFGSSSQSFSVMLMTFISGLALGGLLVSWLLRRERDTLRWLAMAEIGVGLAVLAILPIYERFPYVFARTRALVSHTSGGFTLLQVLQIGLLFGLMLLPTTLLGMTLPLASRTVIEDVDAVGSGVGSVFSSNTLGTLLGVTLTGVVLIPALGLQTTLGLGILLNVLLGVGLLWLADGARVPSRATGAIGLVALLALTPLLALDPWDPVLMTAGFFRRKAPPASFDAMKRDFANHELLYARDGLDMTVTVVEVEDARFLKVNGKTDASTLRGDMVTQVISGHLPMLIHPGEPRDVLIIGLGSGVTAGSVLKHPGAQARVIEISEAVIEGARHFAPENHDVHQHPRLDLVQGDARDYLLLDRAREYDVVISEPSNPWISGVANLFTEEFFRAVRDRMAEDALYVQWLQVYSMSDAAYSRTLNTLRAVFPWVTVWRFNRADALMVASRSPVTITPDTLRARLEAISTELGGDAPVPIEAPIDLLAHQALAADTVSRHFPGRPPLNTDAHPRLEFEAPRAMFTRANLNILDKLDDRLQVAGRGRLLLDDLPESLSGEDRARLGRLFALNKHRELATGLTRSALDLSEPSLRSRALAEGDLELLAALDTHALESVERFSPGDCRVYTTRLSAWLRSQSSAFYTAPLEPLRRLVEGCAQRHPPLALELYTAQAAAHYSHAEPESARRYAQRALGSAEESSLEDARGLIAEALIIAARASLALGEPARAAEAYRRLLELDPGNEEARKALR
ncbi:MAG: hypothetical protein CMH57_14275 [Myxococcales bacterium]|nr:hypothetical protein [Myxococcales bacterium]